MCNNFREIGIGGEEDSECVGEVQKEKALPQPNGCDALSVTCERDKSIFIVVIDQTFLQLVNPSQKFNYIILTNSNTIITRHLKIF